MDGWRKEKPRDDDDGGGLIHTARAVDDTTMTFVVGNNGTHPAPPPTPHSIAIPTVSTLKTQNKHFRLHTHRGYNTNIMELLFLSRADSDSRGSIMISPTPNQPVG